MKSYVPYSCSIFFFRKSILMASPCTSMTFLGSQCRMSCMMPLASAWALNDMYCTDIFTSTCSRTKPRLSQGEAKKKKKRYKSPQKIIQWSVATAWVMSERKRFHSQYNAPSLLNMARNICATTTNVCTYPSHQKATSLIINVVTISWQTGWPYQRGTTAIPNVLSLLKKNF